MLPFPIFLFLVSAEKHVLGIIHLLRSLGRMRISFHHCLTVLGVCLMFLSHGFIAKQTCFLGWSLIYRGLLYFFSLITYFLPLLCPYHLELLNLYWGSKILYLYPLSHVLWRRVIYKLEIWISSLSPKKQRKWRSNWKETPETEPGFVSHGDQLWRES